MVGNLKPFYHQAVSQTTCPRSFINSTMDILYIMLIILSNPISGLRCEVMGQCAQCARLVSLETM